MYQCVLTKEAEREFDKELAYSEVHWGKAHARRYAIELKLQITNILHNPFIYVERSDILPGIRICTYKGSYIVYVVSEKNKQIVIIGLLSRHQSLDPDILGNRIA